MRSLLNYLCITSLLFVSINTFAKEDIGNIDNSVVIDRITNSDIEVSIPSMVFSFKEATIKLKFKNPDHTKLLSNNNKLHFIINGEDVELVFINGESSFTHKFNDNDNSLSIYIEEFSYTHQVTVYPLWAVLLPIGLLVIFFARKKIRRKKR